MTSATHRVLVLDSGLGGLSILRDILSVPTQQPLHCSYLADNDFLPYGDKTATQLQQRLQTLLQPLLAQDSFDAVVIACNTASTLSLPQLRATFTLPFIGVVPAIKTAAAHTRNGRIGLLATAATINGHYSQQLANDFAGHCQLFKLATPQLVMMAEQKLQGTVVDTDALHTLIQPLLDQHIDTGVLGCTHFPWLQPELQQIAPQVQWLDSGAAVARRLHSVLTNIEPPRRTVPAVRRFYHTGSAYTASLTPLLQSLQLHEVMALTGPAQWQTRL